MADLIPYVKARVVEEGDCWIWQQRLDRNGIPIANVNGSGGSLRRKLWLHLNPGKNLGALVATTSCGVRGCVNPDHIVARPLRKAQQAAAKRGAYSQPRAIATRTLAMQRISPLAPHLPRIRELIAQGLSARAIAEEIGCCTSAVARFRAGQSHREVVAGASVFAWRGNITL